VRNVASFAGLEFAECGARSHTESGYAVGLSTQQGLLSIGSEANIVVLSPTGEVRKTIVRGVTSKNHGSTKTPSAARA